MRFLLSLAIAGSLFSVGCYAQTVKSGAPAPAFSAKDVAGKTHDLKTLMKKGPVVLYFINYDCPINAEYTKFYNTLATAYKGKAQFVGVINGDKGIANAWAKQFKPNYPIVLDPDRKIINAYKAEFSPWATMVSKDGKIAKVWDGASQAFLKQMNTEMAKAAKVKPIAFDVKGLPPHPSGG